MKAKEAGYILAIDQASNAAGASLFHNGIYQASTTLLSASKKDSIGKRLATQVGHLSTWLDSLAVPDIKVAIFEGVRARLVLITVGAFCTVKQLQNCKLHPRHSFVESTAWKKWAQKKGATGPLKDIKGIKALKEIGLYTEEISTDDEADSLMQYYTWRDRP